MSHGAEEQFESLIAELLRPVTVGRRRRRLMREELLAHLWQAYEEELARGADESGAVRAAVWRFGRPDSLRDQIQSTVPPFERWFALFPGSKEIAMSIGPRFLGWVMCLVGGAFAFGLAVVMPAAAKLAELTASSPRSGDALGAEQILKASLIGLVAFSFLVTLAGLSILAYAFITRKRTA